MRYGNLTSINASKPPADPESHQRAFAFENSARVEAWTATGVGAQELHVGDDQATPTGYKVTTAGTQSGTLV